MAFYLIPLMTLLTLMANFYIFPPPTYRVLGLAPLLGPETVYLSPACLVVRGTQNVTLLCPYALNVVQITEHAPTHSPDVEETDLLRYTAFGLRITRRILAMQCLEQMSDQDQKAVAHNLQPLLMVRGATMHIWLVTPLALREVIHHRLKKCLSWKSQRRNLISIIPIFTTHIQWSCRVDSSIAD